MDFGIGDRNGLVRTAVLEMGGRNVVMLWAGLCCCACETVVKPPWEQDFFPHVNPAVELKRGEMCQVNLLGKFTEHRNTIPALWSQTRSCPWAPEGPEHQDVDAGPPALDLVFPHSRCGLEPRRHSVPKHPAAHCLALLPSSQWGC